jgi:chaperonin GroES
MTNAAEPEKKMVNLEVKGMRPIGDHVLVTPIPEDDELVAPGGTRFVLADSAKDKPNRGKVVAVGDGRVLPSGQLRPINLKPGERVLFSKYAGNEFSMGGERYIILSHDDVLIVLE